MWSDHNTHTCTKDRDCPWSMGRERPGPVCITRLYVLPAGSANNARIGCGDASCVGLRSARQGRGHTRGRAAPGRPACARRRCSRHTSAETGMKSNIRKESTGHTRMEREGQSLHMRTDRVQSMDGGHGHGDWLSLHNSGVNDGAEPDRHRCSAAAPLLAVDGAHPLCRGTRPDGGGKESQEHEDRPYRHPPKLANDAARGLR